MTQPTQTTSVDSIGSCSLDVNATGTTSPATMEAVDGSRRSLRSVSLENNLSGATSPGTSIETTPLRPILKPQPYTDPGSIKDPGGTTDAGYKIPSYLGISCAVNGYSRLNRYDSSLRDGFRSRDASPARLAFSRSRDSSPMRPEWKVFDPRTKASPQATAAKIRELKEELARFKADFPPPQPERGRQNSSRKLGRKSSQGRSISVDRGYLTKAGSKENMNGYQQDDTTEEGQRVRLVEINMSDSSKMKSSNYQYSFEQSVVRGGVCESSESIHTSSRTNGDTPDKSFIQSRIERLYGPSALGVGFKSRRSLLELEKEQRDRQSAGYGSASSHIDNHYEPEAKAPEGFPSVFRHLRPEFRTQLQVKRNIRLRPDVSLDTSLDINSPKRPGRVIPITLTDTIEKPQLPPVLLPKPQNLVNNRNTLENGVQESNKPFAKKIVNGNGNIKEVNIPIVKDPYVNGGVEEEKENNVIVPNESINRTITKVNGVAETVQVNGDVRSPSSKGEKDGHHYLKIVESVVASIEVEVANTEPYLEIYKSEMNEEVRGKVLAAIGKARLLVSQKIQQFQGLCHKNIAGSIGEEFPTTCGDLAGFWDMVYIQVEDIRQLFKEINDLKSNNWKEIPAVETVDGADRNVSTGHARKKPAPRPIRASKSTKASSEKTEEGKARDEARKKMLEERRKAMREAIKAKKAEAEAKQGDVDNVEIFAPECK